MKTFYTFILTLCFFAQVLHAQQQQDHGTQPQ